MYAKGNPVTPAAVKALAIFKFTRHPKMALHMDAMFSKIDKYNALCGEIPEREERMKKKPRCDKIVDSFDIHAWWKANMAELPHFSYVLRGVLCHSTNSCPAEWVFSILNDSFGDDQSSSYQDYIELSCRLQYNNRTRL